jgi:hypothetical protein
MEYIVILISAIIIILGVKKIYERWQRMHREITSEKINLDADIYKEQIVKNISMHILFTVGLLWLGLMFWAMFKDFTNPSAVTNSIKGSYGASAAEQEGLTKTEWYARCKDFVRSKDECAVSAKVSQCIDIKMGENQANMAGAYCDGANPKFSLMGGIK